MIVFLMFCFVLFLSVPEMENSVFLGLALFRFTLVSSSSFSCSSRRSTAISWSASYPAMYLFFNFPAQWTSIGRGNRRWKAALESLFARITVLIVGINQGA